MRHARLIGDLILYYAEAEPMVPIIMSDEDSSLNVIIVKSWSYGREHVLSYFLHDYFEALHPRLGNIFVWERSIDFLF